MPPKRVMGAASTSGSRRISRSSCGRRGRPGLELPARGEHPGHGLRPGTDLFERVLQRGVRADEAAPGSGLGLAIVRDLAELYGGAIALDSAPIGGLRARLTLPGC